MRGRGQGVAEGDDVLDDRTEAVDNDKCFQLFDTD